MIVLLGEGYKGRSMRLRGVERCLVMVVRRRSFVGV
jgi:hypothetical protein